MKNPPEIAATLRERARAVRRHAMGLWPDEAWGRLIAYARELEKVADQLEQQAAAAEGAQRQHC